MKRFIKQSEAGDQWFIAMPLTKDDFIILRVFYSKMAAEEFLEITHGR